MNTPVTAYTRELKQRRSAPLATPTDLSAKTTLAISPALNAALADVYALYLKTRNFQWRMSGPHFRDWHLMLDEQATQLLAGRRLSGLGQGPRGGEFRCLSRRRRGVWLAHTTSRQRRMAPKISPALWVDPEWG